MIWLSYLCADVSCLIREDPEEMKEMQAQMNQNDPNQMLKNIFGGGGGSQNDDDDD